MLAHGRLLTFDAAGHTAIGRSNCVGDAESAYLVDLHAAAPRARCAVLTAPQ